MRAIYLTGERVYLRAMVEDDKAHVVAWHDSPFPVNSAFGEERLKQLHDKVWDVRRYQLAIVRLTDDEIVGGVSVEFADRDRKASFEVRIAAWIDDAEALRADAIRMLVPWLLEDHNMRRVDVILDSDQHDAIAAAQSLGMFEGVRLREFWRRPHGRVDALFYQILNPNEERRHA
ncbi:MAG TPA: GNAT family protein [Thermomicrobiales bacterium]|nr:GNAT family protein [Thermomicrobiales bacterium]